MFTTREASELVGAGRVLKPGDKEHGVVLLAGARNRRHRGAWRHLKAGYGRESIKSTQTRAFAGESTLHQDTRVKEHFAVAQMAGVSGVHPKRPRTGKSAGLAAAGDTATPGVAGVYLGRGKG